MKEFSIAFDLDGTLIDISKRDYAVYSDILSENGFVPIDFDQYWMLRQNKTNIFELLDLSVTDKNFHELFLKERKQRIEHSDYLKLDDVFDNSYSVLDTLKKNYSLVLVTLRNNKKGTEDQLNNLKLSEYFDNVHVVSGDKYDEYSKIPQLKAIVGDTENDVLSAQRLGVYDIAVTTGIRNKFQLEKLNSQYIIRDLKDILNIIL